MALKDAVTFLEKLKSNRDFCTQFVSLYGNVIAFQTALKAAGLQFTVDEFKQARPTVIGLTRDVEPLLNDLQNPALKYLPVTSVAEDDDYSDYMRQWQHASPP